MNTAGSCPKTDAVLAHHLDGDLDPSLDAGLEDCGYAFASGESLHAHLRACAICQRTLRRARRLDAALATAAGTDVERHPSEVHTPWRDLAQRWLTTAVAPPNATSRSDSEASETETSETEATVHSRGDRTMELVANALAATPAPTAMAIASRWAAAAMIAACLAGPWLVPNPLLPARTTALAANEPNGATRPQPLLVAMPGAMPSPAAVPSQGAHAPVAAGTSPTANTKHRSANHWRPASPATMVAENQPPAPSLRELASRANDGQRATGERLVAAKALLQQSRPFAPEPQRAWLALVDVLAACGDLGPAAVAMHGELLDLVRDNRHTRAWLAASLIALDVPQRRLERADLAVLAVAARVGADDADRLLRRVVRRHADGGEVVAAALRCGVRTTGGAVLLLDLWQDATRAGSASDETQWSWFRGQSDACYREVAAELHVARAESRRLHCLLALGHATDRAAADALLARMAGAHFEEAHTAAFALAHLPPPLLQALATDMNLETTFLLRAALARAGVVAAQPWLQALDLDAAELQLLHTGPRARFPEVASWFRDRHAASD